MHEGLAQLVDHALVELGLLAPDLQVDLLVVLRGEIANDATVFSEITGISPTLVGFAWLAISFAYFIFVLRFVVVAPQPVEANES